MSRNLLDEALRDAAIGWAEESAPPAFDIAAIRRRAFRLSTPPQSARAGRLRFAIAISLAVAISLAAAPSMPAILSKMTRTFHAFAIGDGRVQTAKTRSVTLEEAREDMPFRVLTPVGLPRSFQRNITEVYPSAQRADAQIWFEFIGADPGRSVTILEMAAGSRYAAPMNQAAPSPRQGEIVVTQQQAGKHMTAGAITIGAPATCVSIKMGSTGSPLVRTMCEPPAVGGHGHLVVSSGEGERGASLSTAKMLPPNGAKALRSMNLPVRFVAHRTLVVLFDPSGVLKPRQVDALRAAMSR